jgi:periplasmic protein TonB
VATRQGIIMTAIATHAPHTRFTLNWPRIGALSGSMSVHLYALILMLTPPIAMQLLKRVEPESPIAVHVISEQPPVVEPAPPTPVHHESHPRVTPHVAPVEHAAPAVSETHTEMSIPTTTQATETVTSSAAEDVAPTALAYNTRTRIAYPHEARVRGEHGTVVLRVLVGTDGLPQTVEIETSSGSRTLDIAARDAVKHWSFRPGTRDGAAHSAWARVPIAFDLSTL